MEANISYKLKPSDLTDRKKQEKNRFKKNQCGEGVNYMEALFTKRCSYLQDTDKVERLKNSSFLLFVLILKFQSVSIVNLRSFVTYVDTSETIKITFSAFYFKKVDRFLDFRYLIAVAS